MGVVGIVTLGRGVCGVRVHYIAHTTTTGSRFQRGRVLRTGASEAVWLVVETLDKEMLLLVVVWLRSHRRADDAARRV